MLTNTSFINGPNERKILCCLYQCSSPRGIIVKADGSGEYRSVGTEKSKNEAAWVESLDWSYLCFDKFGCGESEGQWSQVTWKDLIDDLLFVTRFALSKNLPVIVMGHSEGSLLAVEVANQEPQISGAVLRSPSSQDLSERLRMQLGEHAWRDWLRKIENGTDPFVFDHPLTYWRTRLNATLTQTLVEITKVPLLILNGKKDSFTPIHTSEPIHVAVKARKNEDPRFEALYIEEAEHSLLRNSEKWNSSFAAIAIQKWLGQIVPT